MLGPFLILCLASSVLGWPVEGGEGRATSEDLFGATLAPLVDLNGDGVGELLVSAPFSHSRAGSAWVISVASGEALLRVLGEKPGDWFGYEVCATGDLDRDGLPDFAIGWLGRERTEGGVAVYSSRDSRRLLAVRSGDLGLLVGSGVCGLDDFDADELADLAVIARDHEVRNGEHHLTSSILRVLVLSGKDGRELARFEGPLKVDHLGLDLASAADVDGDGLADIVLSASQGHLGGRDFVQVHSGADLRVIHRFERASEECDAGDAIAAAGDVDGDGCGDLLVGTSQTCTSGPLMARVYSGAGGRLLHEYSDTGDIFANSVSAAGDVDGDGHGDFLIGSRSLQNRATLYSGHSGEQIRVWTSFESGFALSVAGTGDLDGDRVPDVAVGSANWYRPSELGSVKLYSSRTGALLRVLDLETLEAFFASRTNPAAGLKER